SAAGADRARRRHHHRDDRDRSGRLGEPSCTAVVDNRLERHTDVACHGCAYRAASMMVAASGASRALNTMTTTTVRTFRWRRLHLTNRGRMPAARSVAVGEPALRRGRRMMFIARSPGPPSHALEAPPPGEAPS